MPNPIQFPPPPTENLVNPETSQEETLHATSLPQPKQTQPTTVSTSPTPQPDPQPTTHPNPQPNNSLPTTPGPVEAKGSERFLVRVYPDKCIAAASCIAIAPKAFKLNQQDTVEILETVVNEKDAQLLLAAQSCPTMAIEIIDIQTNEKIWPN